MALVSKTLLCRLSETHAVGGVKGIAWVNWRVRVMDTVLLTVKFGSHLYGTDTPDSDTDVKEIFVPSAREILLGTHRHGGVAAGRSKAPFERNTKDDVDVERFSLDRFLADLMAGQTWALDVLFAWGNQVPQAVCPMNLGRGLMNSLVIERGRLLSRNVNAFVGYAKKQAARYGIKGSRMDASRRVVELLRALPGGDHLEQHLADLKALEAECATLVSVEKTPLVQILTADPLERDPRPWAVDRSLVVHLEVCGRKCPLGATVKHALDMYEAVLADYGERSRKARLAGGVDWKALSHAVRVNGEAVELLSTGWITFPRPERDLLVEIKTGRRAADDVYAMIEQGLVLLYEANARSTLRETPDRAWAGDLVFETYRDEVVRG